MINDAEQKKIVSNPKKYAFLGYLVIAIVFGGFGGWAYFAKIDSAIISSGIIAVESNRKMVQHLEGGIVEEIFVKEGDTVRTGEILVRLENVQAESNQFIYQDRYLIAQTTKARLLAERFLKDEISFPEELATSTEPRIKAAIDEQYNSFIDRRGVLDTTTNILMARIEQIKQQTIGLQEQKNSFENRVEIMTAELERLREGVALEVTRKNILSSKEVDFIEVHANIGRMKTEIAKAMQSISETELQILQGQQEYKERASSEYKNITAEIQEIQQYLTVANDQLSRLNIRASVDGTIQNLKIHTNSGIVRGGDPLMEIVPADDQLIINAQISPIDVDNVTSGLETEVRFVGFQSRFFPVVTGTIRNVSKDIITPSDNQTLPHFLAKIDVVREALPEEIRDKLSAGMPADIIIRLGERSVVDYLISPLANALTKGFREE
jgi:HlyD family type I secretion membrane fusion protein